MESKKSEGNKAGYFSTVFPPPSSVLGKDLSHSDLNWTLNKHNHQSQARYAQSSSAASKFQENPDRNQGSHNKDRKPVYHNEPLESTYFGSSLNYGGREFYPSTRTKQNSELSKNPYKTEELEYSSNTSATTRGEWWQGSLYY